MSFIKNNINIIYYYAYIIQSKKTNLFKKQIKNILPNNKYIYKATT